MISSEFHLGIAQTLLRDVLGHLEELLVLAAPIPTYTEPPTHGVLSTEPKFLNSSERSSAALVKSWTIYKTRKRPSVYKGQSLN